MLRKPWGMVRGREQRQEISLLVAKQLSAEGFVFTASDQERWIRSGFDGITPSVRRRVINAINVIREREKNI
jgi:hypothetical protein